MTPPDKGTILAIGEVMVELAPMSDGRYARAFAGDTFNTLWHMALLLQGRAHTEFVSRVGQDEYSQALMAEMAADGVGTSGVGRDPRRGMGLYLIERDRAERRFHYWRSAAAARHLADDPAALMQAVDGAALVHLSGITLAILSANARRTLFDVLAQARARGTRVSFDPNIRPRLWQSPRIMRQTMARMLTLTDIALPSFDDEARTWQDTTPDAVMARYSAAGIAETVVKDGAGPVQFCAGGQTGIVVTPPVSDLRDTTGAGDAFNAGYLAGRFSGLVPVQAVALGQAVAAAVLGRYGARADRAAVTALAGRLPVSPARMGWTGG